MKQALGKLSEPTRGRSGWERKGERMQCSTVPKNLSQQRLDKSGRSPIVSSVEQSCHHPCEARLCFCQAHSLHSHNVFGRKPAVGEDRGRASSSYQRSCARGGGLGLLGTAEQFASAAHLQHFICSPRSTSIITDPNPRLFWKWYVPHRMLR